MIEIHLASGRLRRAFLMPRKKAQSLPAMLHSQYQETGTDIKEKNELLTKQLQEIYGNLTDKDFSRGDRIRVNREDRWLPSFDGR